MRHLIHFCLVLVSVYIYACANQGTPTGGPRDTIPPLLTESYPENKSTNITTTEFRFVFSERINADKLKSQLLITPHLENRYKVKVRKNELTLNFDDQFIDSTTFTLNFSDGLVDVTEKNPAINLSYAFSTGPFIDSIYVNGKITDLYSNQAQEEFIVGLYQLTDSLNLFEDKPRYFAKTSETGQFHIENIKNGYYKVLAFKDENRNLVLNPNLEPHGFLTDSLDLTISKDSIRLRTQFINASVYEFIRSKNTGRYFDIQYNKSVLQYEISQLDSNRTLPIPPNNLVKEDKILRFYPIDEFKYDTDSLGLIITSFDSLLNSSVDTTFVKFLETSRKPDEFKFSLSPSSSSFIDSDIVCDINFSKPIQTVYLDSIIFRYDTLKYQYIVDSVIDWNNNRTKFRFSTKLDKQYLKSSIDTLMAQLADTTITDSLTLAKRAYYSQVKINAISLFIPKATFISVENDSTDAINYSYTFKSLEQMGSVGGVITTNESSFIIQLVNAKYQVIDEIRNLKKFIFPYVEPGKYTFRILIDGNQDGRWSSGNILKDQEPEAIYFYPEIFDVRANWQLENIQITF